MTPTEAGATAPIRVVIAARSPLQRARVTALLANQPSLQVVAVIRSADAALESIVAARPDLLLLGTGMLEQANAGLLRQIRQQHSLPVVLLTTQEADPRALEGLEQGAVEFLMLPALPGGAEPTEQAVTLLHQVAEGRRPLPAAKPQPLEASRGGEGTPSQPTLVVIGASTGGPQAVQGVLEALPVGLHASVVVALHMPATFTGLYAERVDRACHLQVREATEGDAVPVGTVLVLPGGQQAELFQLGESVRVRLRPRQPGELHAPSVNRLMVSAARVSGFPLIGVLLTGMGDDGARGMAEIRKAGGHTIAESDRTAVIFGMPGEAIRVGAARAVLPLDEIPAAILELCGVGDPARPGGDGD